MQTTDRVAAHTIVAVRRIDGAIVVEVQVVRVVTITAVRRCRPIVAIAAYIAETATALTAITRSRKENAIAVMITS